MHSSCDLPPAGLAGPWRARATNASSPFLLDALHPARVVMGSPRSSIESWPERRGVGGGTIRWNVAVCMPDKGHESHVCDRRWYMEKAYNGGRCNRLYLSHHRSLKVSVRNSRPNYVGGRVVELETLHNTSVVWYIITYIKLSAISFGRIRACRKP